MAGKRQEKAGNVNNTGVQMHCNCTVVIMSSLNGCHKWEGALVSVKREGLLSDMMCLQ